MERVSIRQYRFEFRPVCASSPGPEPLDDAAVANELIARLRDASGDPAVRFVDPPRRVAGGFETFTYAFRVSASSGKLAGPLILRLFRQPGAARQARREAVFQNALAGLGYPVPRVVMRISASGIGGLPFNVMERVAGRPMTSCLFGGGRNAVDVAEWLAEVHARLHSTPCEAVARAVESAGVPAEAFALHRQLDEMERYVGGGGLRQLRPVLSWLRRNWPARPGARVVCHGDFHPGNVMVDNGTVTGVIDWPGATLAQPEYDVAVTLVLIGAVAGAVYPGARPLLERFRSAYFDAYQRLNPVDPERVRYYEALRCCRAFVHGTALRTPGVDPALRPRDGYPWADAGTMRALAARLGEVTGIQPPLPRGV